MLEVMMALGSYRFGLSTAAYQQLARAASWRWPAQDRIGAAPIRQYVGPGEYTLSVEGVLYPHYRGLLGLPNLVARFPRAAAGLGLGLEVASALTAVGLTTGTGAFALQAMRDDADTGKPLLMVDGRGRVWGHWCLLTLQEVETRHLADGAALAIQFRAELGYYGEQAPDAIAADQSLFGAVRGLLGV